MRPIRAPRLLWAAAQLAALPLAAYPAAAQIHQVPKEYGTIAAAVAAASDGDTILVAPGTWVERLEFDGKELTVASHFLLTQDPDFVGSTVIDGGMGERERNARVVFIGPNQRSAIKLVGLTIQNADDCISSNGRFELIHSRITRCSDGIDCMSDGVSREDYRAHPIPEPIRLTDNVIRGNARTITCGETVLGRNGIRLRAPANGR